jgi:hypothetical protein
MRTSPGVNRLRVWPLSVQIQSVLLSVRRPVSFEGTSGRFGRDAKANQRRKRGPDADVRRGFASRSPARATRHDRPADVTRRPNVAENAIEIIPQVDEGLHDMPSRHRDRNRSTISGNQPRCVSPFGLAHHSTAACARSAAARTTSHSTFG